MRNRGDGKKKVTLHWQVTKEEERRRMACFGAREETLV